MDFEDLAFLVIVVMVRVITMIIVMVIVCFYHWTKDLVRRLYLPFSASS